MLLILYASKHFLKEKRKNWKEATDWDKIGAPFASNILHYEPTWSQAVLNDWFEDKALKMARI